MGGWPKFSDLGLAISANPWIKVRRVHSEQLLISPGESVLGGIGSLFIFDLVGNRFSAFGTSATGVAGEVVCAVDAVEGGLGHFACGGTAAWRIEFL